MYHIDSTCLIHQYQHFTTISGNRYGFKIPLTTVILLSMSFLLLQHLHLTIIGAHTRSLTAAVRGICQEMQATHSSTLVHENIKYFVA